MHFARNSLLPDPFPAGVKRRGSRIGSRVLSASIVSLGIGVLLALVPPATHSSPDGYVDARLCAGCHPSISETYRQTGMARSFYRPRPENTVEDYRLNN